MSNELHNIKYLEELFQLMEKHRIESVDVGGLVVKKTIHLIPPTPRNPDDDDEDE